MTDLQALPDNHILTADDAAWLMEQGACDRALRYIGHTVAVAAMSDPWAALRYAAARLSDEQFAAAARADPEAALEHARDRYAALLGKDTAPDAS